MYDSASDRALFIGGTVGEIQFASYRLPTWELAVATGTWTQREIPSIERATMRTCAWDEVRRHYWMFGPIHGHALRIDLGSGEASREIVFEGADPSTWHQVAFDSEHDRFLVVARPPHPFAADTLALYSAPLADTLRFSRIPIRGPEPRRFWQPSAVWDPVRATFVVATSTTGYSTPLVLVNLHTGGDPHWEAILVEPDPVAGAPPILYGLSMVKDPASRDLYLFSVNVVGVNHAVWRLEREPVARWTRLVAPPISAFRNTLIADSRRRRLISHGGHDYGASISTTRYFDIATSKWEVSEAVLVPEPRSSYAVAYDHARDRVMLFGGHDGRAVDSFTDLWERDSHDGRWQRVLTEGAPPTLRINPFLVEDERRARFLLVGGWLPWGIPTEVWQLSLEDSPAWSQFATVGEPPTRVDGVFLDAARRRLIIHGIGYELYDTGEWELTLDAPATWRRLPVAGTASPPQWCGFALDEARDRAVLFGGYANPNDPTMGHDELWGFSLAADTVRWEKLSGPHPLIRVRFNFYANPGGIVVDPVRDRLVSFGGYGSTTVEWEASDLATTVPLSGSPIWTDFAPEFGGPPPTYDHALVYDPVRDSFIMFGAGHLTVTSTTFEWQGLREGWPDVQARVTSPYPPAVRLEWSAPAGPTDVIVKRRDLGVWRTIGRALRAADGRLHFTDSNIPAGTDVSYRLAWPAANGLIPVGELTLTTDLPEASAIRIRDNPARTSIAMDLDLPLTGSVRVELIDLAGRRVRGQGFELWTPGRREFQFTDLGGVSPGLYFVRVTSPAGVRNARVTLLR